MFKPGDVETVLARLHIDGIQRGDNITASCPMHSFVKGVEDANPSWGIHVSTGLHNCFSCGYKGNLLTLVSDYLDLGGIEEAKLWLNQLLEVDWEFLSQQLEEARRTHYSVPRLVPMSEGRLGIFDEVPEWAAKDRKLTVDSCNHFGIRWRSTDSTWIIPIRTEEGQLLGWQEKGHLTRKFFNRPPGVAKSKTLFGLHKWEGSQMIVVESPLDVVRLHTMGIDGGVAIYGAVSSADQIKLMRRSEKLIIALDNDDTGRESTKTLTAELRKQGMEYWKFNYNGYNVKDIGDMLESEVDYSLNHAIHCVLELL